MQIRVGKNTMCEREGKGIGPHNMLDGLLTNFSGQQDY